MKTIIFTICLGLANIAFADRSAEEICKKPSPGDMETVCLEATMAILRMEGAPAIAPKPLATPAPIATPTPPQAPALAIMTPYTGEVTHAPPRPYYSQRPYYAPPPMPPTPPPYAYMPPPRPYYASAARTLPIPQPAPAPAPIAQPTAPSVPAGFRQVVYHQTAMEARERANMRPRVLSYAVDADCAGCDDPTYVTAVREIVTDSSAPLIMEVDGAHPSGEIGTEMRSVILHGQVQPSRRPTISPGRHKIRFLARGHVVVKFTRVKHDPGDKYDSAGCSFTTEASENHPGYMGDLLYACR